MNAIEYGSQGDPSVPVEVARRTPTASDLVVRDHRPGARRAASRTPRRPTSRRSSPGEQKPRGWGLFLIEHMVDEMDVATDDDRQTVTLTLAPGRSRRWPASPFGAEVATDRRRARAIALAGDVDGAAEDAPGRRLRRGRGDRRRRAIVLDFARRRLHQQHRHRADRAAPRRGPARPPRGRAPAACPTHYREIFQITRLSDFMTIADDDAGDAGHRGGSPMTRHHDVDVRPSTGADRASCASTGDITVGSEDAADGRLRRRERGGRDGRSSSTSAGLEYMNSGGIGLLVTLLVRAQRAGQRLLAFGLTEHYRQIFELTRLDEAIGIHDDEADALAAARPDPRPQTADRREPQRRRPAMTTPDPARPATRSVGPARRPPDRPPRRRRPGHRQREARRRSRPGLRPDVAEDVHGPPRRASSTTPAGGHRGRGRSSFPSFWPKGTTFYAPLTGHRAGRGGADRDRRRCPGAGEVSTGVMVIYADDESFTFMTPEGHMFVGWITFSAYRDGDVTVAQAQVLERAQRPVQRDGATCSAATG